MKVGILGSGDVGKVLAGAFKNEGHKVMIATRDIKSAKAAELVELGLKVGTFAQVAKFCELAVLCTLWEGAENAIKLAGPANLEDKIVIDATNPLDFSAGMPPVLVKGRTDSGGEQIQRWLKKSKVVKAFNIVGNAHMYKPQLSETLPTMFFCGNDAGAKEVVKTILLEFGWQPLDIGDITGSRELEPLCILWVKIGMKTNSWDHAFNLISK